MAGWLNIGSCILGTAACVIPIVSLLASRKSGRHNWLFFAAASGMCCAMALWLKLAYMNYLVRINDWTALLDTANTTLFRTLALAVVFTALNWFCVHVHRGDRTAEDN